MRGSREEREVRRKRGKRGEKEGKKKKRKRREGVGWESEGTSTVFVPSLFSLILGFSSRNVMAVILSSTVFVKSKKRRKKREKRGGGDERRILLPVVYKASYDDGPFDFVLRASKKKHK
jgi:hypothetical protein